MINLLSLISGQSVLLVGRASRAITSLATAIPFIYIFALAERYMS